ncbi:SLC5 family protein [Pelagicoccus mobilis]|uniref:Sodium/solute symporter n=1 Tax=Pelagicoccus mobilis TaxID=415221 RepID=A0A934RVW7_9BACT|nr:sodium/solute symporter [Pelagicoccus mobilis]MBK1876119.1 sodium/solute symporter [Pelagicoccus mobilis]
MDTLRITQLDIAIVAVAFFTTMGFGLWFGRRKVASSEALFLADRDATWPLIGASLFSANISSQQFVGQAGLAYAIGLAAGAFQLVGALCFALLAIFFVDVYLGLRLRTAPEFFEKRYHVGARMCVSGINLVIILAANVATALYAGATVLADLAGWNGETQFALAVGVIALAAGVTTIAGGLRSVLWMDLLLATLLITGGAITLVMSIQHAGGWSEATAVFDADGNSFWSVIQPWFREFGWLPLATGAVILGVHGHCTDQDYVQRALAARSVYHSKMGALFAGVLKVVALLIIAAPGVVAAKLMPGLEHPDQAYARVVAMYVPSGLAGLVFAGLFSAILGTVAAGLAASSSLISFDFIGRLAPGLSERRRVVIGRIVMASLLTVCALLAPSIREFQGVYVYIVRLGAALGPAVFVCVVAGIFTRRASGRGATATLVAGTIFGVSAYFIQSSPEMAESLPLYLRSSLNTSFLNTLFCAVVMYLASDPVEGAARAEVVLEERRDAPDRETMTDVERRKYRLALLTLAIVWSATLFVFSPWGVAGDREEPQSAQIESTP